MSKALLDTALEDHAPMSNTRAATAADVAIRAEAQHAPATADAAQFAKLAAIGLFDPAAEADVDKALDEVLGGLRALEGLEEGRLARVSHVSRGFVSADFARLVEDAVKAKLKAEAEARRLIKAVRVGEAAPRGDFDRFALNAAATVDTALGLVYEALRQKWEAKARPGLVENYAHVDKKFAEVFKVHERGMVHYLRYNVGDVVYGDAKAEGAVVLVLLGGEDSIRVEVLAKSVAGLPIRFEEKEWSGERWVWLATAWINKPKHYVAEIKLRFAEKPKVEVRGGAAGVEGLRGLLATDAYRKEIETPDPLLVKLFASHFEKVSVRVDRVSLTKAGPTPQLKAVVLDDKPFIELFGDIAERYGKNLWFIADKAREMWRETMRKLYNDVMRVADEAAEVGGGKRDVEAGRRALVDGLKRLFEEKEREASSAGRNEEALAIAVTGRLLLGIVNSPREWLSLLAGDGVVDFVNKTVGFSAKYAEVAEAVLRLLATWAGAYGAEIRVLNEHNAVYASSDDAAKVLKAVLKGEVLEYATSLAKSWIGLAGSRAPKVVSLLALAQLLGVVEGEWAVELWLAHKAVTTPVESEVAQVLDKLFARVEGVGEVKWRERGVNLSFKVRGLEGFEQAVTLKLYTDFARFYLYCDCDDGATKERVLRAVAEWLRPAVGQLGWTAEGREWPRWVGNALVLPAEVGWAVFLKLWRGYNMSLRVEEGGRELLRVEVLDVKSNGEAKFRLWYYKWRETRPQRPYVDVEITQYHFKDGRVGFIDRVYANEVEGISKDRLAEIARLLEREGIKGVTLKGNGKQLQFTGAFRDSVLGKLGIKPELPPGEPPALEYLGGLRFRVGDREVEFGERAFGATRELYAELKFPSRDEAERFARSLKAIGVDARVAGSEKAGYAVRLDSDAFFGLLAATNAAPPSLKPLYNSEEDDLRVYANMEGGRMRFYFAVRHEGVWRVAEGLFVEKWVQLSRKEREVLEALRGAVERALEKLVSEQQGRLAKVGESKEEKGEGGNVKVYRLHLFGHHLAPFLEHAADRVEAKPAEVRLEGRRIIIEASGVEAAIDFRLLKRGEAEFLLAKDVEQTLVLYKSLKELGMRVEITPKGVKVDGDAMWALVAVERSAPSGLPREVMPGVELLKMYSASDMRMYAFRVSEEGVYYYFAVKTKEG